MSKYLKPPIKLLNKMQPVLDKQSLHNDLKDQAQICTLGLLQLQPACGGWLGLASPTSYPTQALILGGLEGGCWLWGACPFGPGRGWRGPEQGWRCPASPPGSPWGHRSYWAVSVTPLGRPATNTHSSMVHIRVELWGSMKPTSGDIWAHPQPTNCLPVSSEWVLLRVPSWTALCQPLGQPREVLSEFLSS